MPLNRFDLVGRLKQSVDPRYFVFGRELYLVERCCNVIREHAKKEGYSERIVFNASVDFDWDVLDDQLTEQSLFASKKFIELRLPPSGRPGMQGAKALTSALQNQDDDTSLLVIGGALDRSARNSKWFKSWEQEAIVVDNPEMNVRQFSDWIRESLDRGGIQYERDVVGRLAYYFEGNMLAAANELQKIRLGNDGATLTVSKLEQIVVDQAKFNVFALNDACLKGDAERAIRLLKTLKNEGAEPIVLLMTLAREVRIVYKVAFAVSNNLALGDIFKQYQIWKARESMVRAAADRLGVGGSARLLRRLARADRILKGRDDPPVGGTVWHELEKIILGMCGQPTRSTPPMRFSNVR